MTNNPVIAVQRIVWFSGAREVRILRLDKSGRYDERKYENVSNNSLTRLIGALERNGWQGKQMYGTWAIWEWRPAKKDAAS